MKAVLGIDPGTACGWCVEIIGDVQYGGSTTWTSGVWDLSAKRHEGGGMRFLRLRGYLREMLDTFQPVAVFYEEVRRHRGVDAAHVYGGIAAVVSEECESRKIPYKGIPVGTVKQFATGKGNADKDDMLAACEAVWPDATLADDNEADARWVTVAGVDLVKGGL